MVVRMLHRSDLWPEREHRTTDDGPYAPKFWLDVKTVVRRSKFGFVVICDLQPPTLPSERFACSLNIDFEFLLENCEPNSHLISLKVTFNIHGFNLDIDCEFSMENCKPNSNPLLGERERERELG